MTDNQDRLYSDAHATLKPFQFDARVAGVFQDMISRSVPGYQQILELLPTLARHLEDVDGDYYDLGCSLGAGMFAISQGLQGSSKKIIGVDNSKAMLAQAKDYLTELTSQSPVDMQGFDLICQDIRDCDINTASMVLMNFTLQFVPLSDRDKLTHKIYDGLNDGGALVLSEKLKFSDKKIDQRLTDIHHQYKADQGYSRLEIAQKRDAIENVLIPETLSAHQQRLNDVGFTIVTPWIQNLQFVSILAIK